MNFRTEEGSPKDNVSSSNCSNSASVETRSLRLRRAALNWDRANLGSENMVKCMRFETEENRIKDLTGSLEKMLRTISSGRSCDSAIA